MAYKGYALVVDNSPVFQKIVRSVLEKEGWDVKTAENGLEALDSIHILKPDIIFTDLVMPKIDGEKFAYILRNTPDYNDIFLVILSAIAVEDNENTLCLNADACIAKGPFSHMRTHILEALEAYQTGVRKTRDIEGGKLYYREITAELLESKRHSEIIVANMSDGVVELNDKGRLVMINKAAIELMGEGEEKLFGRNFFDYFVEKDREVIQEWLAGLNKKNKLEGLVFEYQQPAVIRHSKCQIALRLLPVPEEEELFIVGILTDLTRQKQTEKRRKMLEKELERIRKFDAMSLLISGLAHDFNNLLTILSGNIEMSRYLSREKQVTDLLEEASNALELSIKLVRKLSTFSDNHLAEHKRTDLSALIRETLDYKLADTSITYAVEDNICHPLLRLDPSLFEQVFSNLADNVVGAIKGKGHVQVTLDLVDGESEAELRQHPVPEGKLVRVIFSDNGPGIPKDLVDKVFDPYFSTKEKGVQKGMGLGLTIVHSIIKKHNGAIIIDRQTGCGCVVNIYLPVSAGYNSGRRSEVDASFQTDERKNVLIMEEDDMIGAINKRVFELCRYNVTLARNTVEVIEKYCEAEEKKSGFDLVLVSIDRYREKQGLETAQKILEINPAAVLIAACGDAACEEMLRRKDHGFASTLTTPFSVAAVQEMISCLPDFL
ncbi:MAG: hypothetical protein CSA32_03760 [Desulfobulbus propionicus]|nr:MAG: hypothetical protein CSA32_03760 [Desulfobulbus propionicus]